MVTIERIMLYTMAIQALEMCCGTAHFKMVTGRASPGAQGVYLYDDHPPNHAGTQ